jgi:PAS domain S-box-containing protein
MSTPSSANISSSALREQLFRVIFENAATGIARIDRYGHFIMVNDKVAEITGYTKEELLQKTFQEITHPDDLEPDLKQAEAIYKGEISSYSMEKRYIRKDGSTVWIKLTGSAVFDESGNFEMFVGIIDDISGKKKTEEALRKSLQEYKIASAAAKIGSFYRNLQTGEDHWSPEFLALYGLKPGESFPLKDNIPEAVHPDDRENVLNLAQRHYDQSDNTEFSSDHRILLPDGTFRWVHVRGITVRDLQKNPVTTYGIAMDITERKEAEEALRKSEIKYRALFNSIDEGFCICEILTDKKGIPYDYRWLEINPAWEKQTGLKNPVGRTALELVPNLEQHWIDVYVNVALTGEPVRFQQGSEAMGRWFDVYAFRVGEPHLRQFGILFNHITARRQTEEMLMQKEHVLRENKELLQAAVEGGSLGTWDLNLITGTAIRSLRHDQIWGHPQGIENWSLELAMNQVLPEDHPIITEAYEKAFRTGTVFHENRIIWPDGSIHWIAASGSIRYDEKGEPVRVTGVVEDITYRKEAEKQLQENEKKFRTLANNISQLVWMSDIKGKVFWYNQRWLDYTGSSPQKLMKWGWKKIIHPAHLKVAKKSINRAVKTGKAWEEIIPLKNKEGEYRWFLARAIPVNAEEKETRWFGTATDITKQREIEGLLIKDKELIENLLYIAAHDLKGPVANMYGALNLMDNLREEKKLTILEHFRKIAGQLDKTIRGITDILRVRNTDISAASVLYFEGLLYDLLLEFRDELNPASVDRSFLNKPSIRYIEPFLNSILKNLISNSIKYSRENVPLQISISTKTEGNFTILTYSDNGIGINLNKYGKKLFSPFQRLEVDKATGTGIGLYLIKNIVEKNGGQIKVESTAGEGTTFYCYLKEYP